MRRYSIVTVFLCIIFSLSLFSSCDQLFETTEAEAVGPFSVTFVTNGGTEVTALSVENNQAATKPRDPTKIKYTFDRDNPGASGETKYVFIGWYSDVELTKRFDFATKITENKTLYAKWRPIAKSKISLTPSGGSLTEYEKTEEIYAIDREKVGSNLTRIPGGIPSFISESADSEDKGIFMYWAERTVGLSPFIMSRYEVTRELYSAVMTGNSFTSSTPGVTIRNSEGNVVSPGDTTYSIDPAPSICAGDDYPIPEGENVAKRPVDNVTWYDAVYFCNRLSESQNLTAAYTVTNMTLTLNPATQGGDTPTIGHITNASVSQVSEATGYRLPTELEWEFAARGGDSSIDPWNYMFSGADTENSKAYSDVNNSGLDSVGWYAFNVANANGKTALIIPPVGDEARVAWGAREVGKKGYNELGLYDMSGNVAEWCFDTPIFLADKDPAGATASNDRVVRGGSWHTSASDCVVSHRDFVNPNTKASDIGFRLARSLPAN
ncbi:MAG: SUMF1/EgtB/PvdO family nonheme iron enzyme [Treponemataceae bacterium]|nr:SUMF1/EgtB/PvdO family nonheme iron enzyme [Treponemataceae bacterium]